METTNYTEPVAKLLTYGHPDKEERNEWPTRKAKQKMTKASRKKNHRK